MSLDQILDAVQRVGFPIVLSMVILWFVTKVLMYALSLADKHLTRLFDTHEAERLRWNEVYEKHTQSVDRAMQFFREEHIKIIAILDAMQKK